jgi:hypothetical protein
VKLTLLRSADPEPMTDQDLQDWGGAVDAKSGVGRLSGGRTPENVLNAGQAAVDVTNARRGRS